MIDEREYQEFEDSIINSDNNYNDVGDEIIESGNRYFDNFDNAISDIDFSELKGDFKRSLNSVNRKIEKKSTKGRFVRKPKSVIKDIPVRKKATITANKPISKVIVPSDKKVIVENVSKFILSQKPEAESIKTLGYYKGQKLNLMTLIFNNNSLLDFNLEVFNPSMPLDYLYSTSLNLNNKIQVAGGAVAYSDVLFNLLANPALFINAKFVIAGPQVQQQLSVPLQVINKSIEGVEKIDPLNVALQIDNMQVQNDMVVFDIMKNLNRPYIPDGMDVVSYKVLAGNTVTMSFWYKQVSLKKVFYKEARDSRPLL
jgi:hypothetical protein